MTLQQKLNDIAQQLKKGVTAERATVREILSWLGVSRRGSNVNWQIRRALVKAGLETNPNFEWTYVDGHVKFVAMGSDEDEKAISTTYRIDALESANREPVSVKPDNTLAKAITIMLTNNFSQLPVMTTPREVKGVISWRSVGTRMALSKKCTTVRECMETARTLSDETSLFEAIHIIAEHDYVLVKAQDKTICGIVTASDLSEHFRDLAEPFMLIGQCESLLRRLIHGKFGRKELEEAKDPTDSSRTVVGVADLTVGEYVRLLEEPSCWDKLSLSLDRQEFVELLKKFRDIRNDIMHFDPQGIDPKDIQLLRSFVRLLEKLRRIGVA